VTAHPKDRFFVARCYGVLGVAYWVDDLHCYRYHRTETLPGAGWIPVSPSQIEYVSDLPGNPTAVSR